jgi:hypothetical protein
VRVLPRSFSFSLSLSLSRARARSLSLCLSVDLSLSLCLTLALFEFEHSFLGRWLGGRARRGRCASHFIRPLPLARHVRGRAWRLPDAVPSK